MSKKGADFQYFAQIYNEDTDFIFFKQIFNQLNPNFKLKLKPGLTNCNEKMKEPSVN